MSAAQRLSLLPEPADWKGKQREGANKMIDGSGDASV